MLSGALGVLASPPSIHASYSTVVNVHVSDLMPVFLSDELNFEWDSRLSSQEMVYSHTHGTLSYQQRAMPFPLAPRDTLLKCGVRVLRRQSRLTSECRSVRDDVAVPPRPGAVRLHLEHTAWRIEALPAVKGVPRTALSLDITVPPDAAHGVPAAVVRHVQKKSLRDSVDSLLAASKRLHLPPHRDFLSWQRTREEARAAERRSGQQGGGEWTEWGGLPSGSLAATSLLVVAHCTAFAVLAIVHPRGSWRRSVRLVASFVM